MRVFLVTNFWYLSHEQKLFSGARLFGGWKLKAALPHQKLLLCSVFGRKTISFLTFSTNLFLAAGGLEAALTGLVLQRGGLPG